MVYPLTGSHNHDHCQSLHNKVINMEKGGRRKILL